MRFWGPLRRRRGWHQHGLADVEVRGQEHVLAALDARQGVLITPNHPTHADPFVLLEVADQLARPFYFMTAWQVFAKTHWLGREVLRQHGAFSINREGHDLRALRQAVRILQEGEHPLVIFPEGEVFHLNDRVTHFRRGAAAIALRTAHRSGDPVACVPCGMKYQYVDDPMPRLLELMGRLERRFSWHPLSEMPLAKRIQRVGDCWMGMKEVEYFGSSGNSSLPERRGQLMLALLGRLEDRYGVWSAKSTIPERVKELRRRAINRLESTGDHCHKNQAQRDLEDLFFVNQLFSYPSGYVTENPSVERLAETLDKLEEDLLHVQTANIRGRRKAVVCFGEPVLAEPGSVRPATAQAITATLQHRVQQLLNAINGINAAPAESEAFECPVTVRTRNPALQAA
jgi:1-acyl-sn-glycerol-3-phosphate acyltransferase